MAWLSVLFAAAEKVPTRQAGNELMAVEFPAIRQVLYRGIQLLLLGAATCAAPGCSALFIGQTTESATSGSPPEPDLGWAQGYTLQPGDIIRISVWREPELDQVLLVRPDGGISFPLVGEIFAAGRTIEDVSFEVAEKLAVYIPRPEVSVSLQQGEGNRIYVTGKVNEPGMFMVTGPVTIMQALSLARGLTPFADKDSILVIRREGESQRSIPFNYNQVRRGQRLGQNITLQAGDTVIVP